MNTLTRITKENLHEILGATYFELWLNQNGDNKICGDAFKIACYLQKKYKIEVKLSLEEEANTVMFLIGDIDSNGVEGLIVYAVLKQNIILFAETLLTHMQYRALVMAANFQNLSKELRDAAKLNEVEEINAVIENCLARTGDD